MWCDVYEGKSIGPTPHDSNQTLCSIIAKKRITQLSPKIHTIIIFINVWVISRSISSAPLLLVFWLVSCLSSRLQCSLISNIFITSADQVFEKWILQISSESIGRRKICSYFVVFIGRNIEEIFHKFLRLIAKKLRILRQLLALVLKHWFWKCFERTIYNILLISFTTFQSNFCEKPLRKPRLEIVELVAFFYHFCQYLVVSLVLTSLFSLSSLFSLE